MQHPSASIDQISALPISAPTCYSRGEALANMGRFLEALEHFDRTLVLDPDHSKAWTFRGVVLIHLDRSEEALESCDRSLSIDPSDSEAWMFRGVALQRLNCYREAYASYDRALGIQRRSIWQRLLHRSDRQA